MTVNAIKVFLVEDQAMVLGALVALLERESDIDVIGHATSAEEALALLAGAELDVLLTDIELPGESGLDLAEKIHAASPDVRIVMLTTFGRAGYFERAMAAGASAYILKDSPASELAAAIRKVHSGGRIIDPELVAASWASPNPLTDRERQCLKLAGEGLSNSDIAEKVFLSEGTVRNYLSSALAKLNAGNRTEAARLATQNGWI